VHHAAQALYFKMALSTGLKVLEATEKILKCIVEFVREPNAQLGLDLGPFTRGQELTFPMLSSEPQC
jgi:hypothetical protein